ncbi:MAG: hypothetical protein Q9225_001083 [Loekoesia sp. 1 TL-2023]
MPALEYGFGRHIYIWGNVEGPQKARQWYKILYIFELFYVTGSTVAKYSILSFRLTIRSVIFTSIIWVVVLSRITRYDVTWNYVNASLWSALEPSMAVICACIPSLRPLFSLGVRGAHRISSISKGKLPSSTGRRAWPGSRSKPSDGMFSQLHEQPEDVKPLGHDVSVHADLEADPEATELPLRGIHVKTEVSISTDRLEYKDRLF